MTTPTTPPPPPQQQRHATDCEQDVAAKRSGENANRADASGEIASDADWSTCFDGLADNGSAVDVLAIYSSLRHAERTVADYMPFYAGAAVTAAAAATNGGSERFIDDTCRVTLVEWLVGLCVDQRIASQTLHIAVRLLDAYLATLVTQSSPPLLLPLERLQLAGVAALWVASKVEERLALSANELVYYCANQYTRAEFVDMEYDMVVCLRGCVRPVHALDFARIYTAATATAAAATPPCPRHLRLVTALCDLAAVYHGSAAAPPSHVAAAAHCVALHALDQRALDAYWRGTPLWRASLPGCRATRPTAPLPDAAVRAYAIRLHATARRHLHTGPQSTDGGDAAQELRAKHADLLAAISIPCCPPCLMLWQ